MKSQQINWIGRSEGALIKFKVQSSKACPELAEGFKVGELEVFTTRPDTLFGCTYMVVCPEHEIIKNYESRIMNYGEVAEYINNARKKSDLERTENKEKTGVEVKGISAINPVNGEEIPIFAADYVLAGYGTGAIMAVPAHDERDFEFAKKYDLAIKEVVAPYSCFDPRKDCETEKRDVVTAIVKDPKNNKYLCLNWKTTAWKSFPSGGIDNDDLIEAAKREVREETGYTDIKFIRQIGDSIYAEFYRPHKNSNVFSHFKYLLFELENENRIDVEEKEINQHEVVWVDEDQIDSYINVWNQKLIWKRYKDGDFAHTEEGIAINSEFLNGLKTKDAKEKMIEWLEKNKTGKKEVQYKLRDWVFSRQRYWGEPMPVVYCEHCKEIILRNKNQWELEIENWKLIGNWKLEIENLEFSKGELLNPGWVALSENQLPLTLPDVKSYEPTDTGESPLANVKDWIATTCPKCGGEARRETDTMPNWAGSSWYFLRYIDPKNDNALADHEKLKYWMQVDLYNGGMEHTTLHLLYSRFWNKFLYDIGVVPYSEPYARRVSHGMILAEDGKKMSKSLGNVINPDDVVREFGADALRAYEMFMGPYAESIPWSTDGLKGVRKFLEKVWGLQDRIKNYELRIKNGKQENYDVETRFIASKNEGQDKIKSLLHKTIKKVTEDIDNFKFNTAISAMMILANEMEHEEAINGDDYKLLILILSPFAPHMCEELWEKLHTPNPSQEGKEVNELFSIFKQPWPYYDSELVKDENVELVIQINGKV
ncbi:MAG: class I tRNA ligase family protein, partial [bacterium]